MSDVWKFFGKVGPANDGTGESVKCFLCHTKLKQTMGSTSSMKKHMEKLHPKAWFERNQIHSANPEAMKIDVEKHRKSAAAKLSRFANPDDDSSLPSQPDSDDIGSTSFSSQPVSTSSVVAKDKEYEVMCLDSDSERESEQETTQHKSMSSITSGNPTRVRTRPSSSSRSSAADRVAEMFNTPYTTGSSQHRRLTDLVLNYLLEDGLPLYTVEKEGFRRLLNGFDSRYQLPSRSHFNRTLLPRRFEEVFARVKSDVKSVSHFAATTDMWTSRTNDPYMSFTIHWIDEQFRLCVRSLQVLHVPEAHTADNIGVMLDNVLKDWELSPDKLTAITTDNASNIVKAMNDKGWIRIQCFGHRLNLAVKKALKVVDGDIKTSLENMRKVIGHFSHSCTKTAALKDAQTRVNIPSHSLIKDCDTRWGSMFASVQRFIEQEPAIRAVLTKDYSSTHLLLDMDKMTILRSVADALKPVSTLTDILSGEKDVTISGVLPTLAILRVRLTKPVADDELINTELVKRIREEILRYMDTHYSPLGVQEFYQKASFLDPRYKSRFSPGIEPKIRDEARLLVDADTLPVSSAGAVSAQESATKTSLSDLLQELEDDREVVEPEVESGTDKEVSLYSSLPRVRYASSCPLNWWRDHHSTFPHLSQLAKKYLCVPATSVPSERIFSAAGNIVTNKRNCLKPEKVNKLCFLAANILH